MSLKVIKGTQKLAEAIKSRRQELGLTIEEAASRAGVGTKTWCRYETGESIRNDKAKGICKALNWHIIPSESNDDGVEFNLSRYKNHEAWSRYICDKFGEAAAISFVIGSDIVLDYLDDDLRELATLPKGTHVGQLPFSMMQAILPEQFLMRYDYEFLYSLRATVVKIREIAHYSNCLLAHSVMDELAIYLFAKESEFLMECMMEDMEDQHVKGLYMWQEWIFDLFEDKDIETFLYADYCLPEDHIYHYNHWTEDQFYM